MYILQQSEEKLRMENEILREYKKNFIHDHK